MKNLIIFGLAVMLALPSAAIDSEPVKKAKNGGTTVSVEGKKKPKKGKQPIKRKYRYRPGARQL
jgi:hypothetical protein